MNVIHDDHASQSGFEAFDLSHASEPWSDLLVEAGFVGAVFLALALIVAASVGR